MAQALQGAVLGAAGLADVVGRLVDESVDTTRAWQLLTAAGVRNEPVTEGDAELAGALRALPGGRAVSLGDRCCLALTARTDPPSVVTADRARADLDVPVHVQLLG